MRRWLPFLIITAVALLTFVAGSVLYRNLRQRATVLSQEQLEAGRRNSVHVRGAPKAPVTIEEFGDFQCPPCGRLSEPLNELERAFAGKVQLVFRQFPLPIHKHAPAAAYAAEAAGLQGKFWEMHDLLYREQGAWSEAADVSSLFSFYAGILKLDVKRFEQDSSGEMVRARVAADQKRAAELNVELTPSVFVNRKIASWSSPQSSRIAEGGGSRPRCS